ncbi:MAG TPA: PAS domain-containing protein [Pyrinomonadaceae bacterium]|jgi:PAS domain S-box-containing protein
MKAPEQESTAAIQSLQRCINNLAEVLAFPPVRADGKSADFVSRLLETLLQMLDLDFVYARLNEMEEEPKEFVRIAKSLQIDNSPREIGEFVKPWLGKSPQKSHRVVKNPFNVGNLSIVISPLGLKSEFGQIVTASQRLDFPEQTEKLVLDVAANQALIRLQAAHLRKERKPVAVEFDQTEAQRAKEELAEVNKELKKKIAKLKRTEDELRESERELHLVVDNIPGLVALLSPTGGVEVVNRELTEYFGQTLEELNQWGTNNGTVHAEDLPHVIETFTRSLTDGTPYDIVQRFRRFDGVYRWFQNKGFPLRDNNGQITRWCVLLTDIDERERAEEALRWSERQFRLLVETIPALVWCGTPEGELAYLNQRAVEYLGQTAQSLIGGGWLELVHPDHRDATIRRWLHSAATGLPYEDTYQIRHSDGQYRWIQSVGEPFRDTDGRIACWYGLIIDIDELKRADEALRKSEHDWRLIVDSIPGLIAVFTPEGEVEFVNRQNAEYFGKTLEEMKQWGAEDMTHPDDRSRVLKLFRQAIATGAPFDFELRARRFDGVYRWVRTRGAPLRDADGRIVRWYNLIIDIDERKRAEEALAASEINLKLTIDTIPAMAWSARPDGSADFFSQHYLDYIGFSAEQASGWGWTAAVHHDDREGLAATWKGIMDRGVLGEAEARVRRYDGEYRWFLFRANPMHDEKGNIVKWYGVNTDIEDRKRTTDALRRSEAFLIEGYRLTQTVGYRLDVATGKVFAYPEVQSTFAPQQNDDVTEPSFFFDRIHHEDRARVREEFERCLRECVPYRAEYRVALPDGGVRYQLSIGHPVLNENGELVEFIGAATDITEHWQATNELERAYESLRERERELRLIVDSIPGLVAVFTTSGEVEFVSRQVLEYFGKTGEEMIGWTTGDQTHPEDLPRAVELFTHSIVTGNPFEVEVRIRDAHGNYRWIQSRALPLRDTNGRIVRWYCLMTDIDERKRAEEALAASERELFLIVDSLPGMVATFTPGGELEFVNRQILEYFGKSLEELKRWGTGETLHPEEKARVAESFARAMTTGEPFEFESRYRRFDGVYRWHHSRGFPLRDTDGRIVRWYNLIIDIDERKQSEFLLRESERQFKTIFDEAGTGIALIDLTAGKPIRNNRALQKMLDCTEDELGKLETYDQLTHEDDRERDRMTFRELSTGKSESLRIEKHFILKGGKSIWTNIIFTLLRDDDGHPRYIIAIFEDITERKLVLEQLQAKQDLIDLAQKSAGATAFDWYVQEEINYWSPEQEALFGLAPGTFDGTYQTFKKMMYAPDWPTVVNALKHAHQTGKVAAEYRVVWPDGSLHWLSTSGRMFLDDEGKPFRMVGFTSDVTPRKLAEEELRRSQAFLLEAQRLSSTGSFSRHLPTNTVTLSDEFCRIFEFDGSVTPTLEMIINRIHPDDFAMWAEAADKTREGKNFELDYRLLMPDGRVKHLHAVAHPTPNSAGELENIGAVQDVTAQRVSEESLSKLRSELAHVSRVMTLGTLTASIAHEVNQPLSGIITNASTCLRMLDVNPPNIEAAREIARRIIRDGNRASDVIKRLRALFSKKDFIVESVDLNDAAQEVTALLKNEFQRSQIVLQMELAKDLPTVAGDRVQLQQVILNLLLNAVDAMIDVNDRPRQLTVTTEPDGGDRVRLSVSDIGVGFAADASEQLFNAFYTTKMSGMGIGLSVSRSIIERHMGRLWAASNDGPGAVFSFSIPVQGGSGDDHSATAAADDNKNL